MHLSFWGERQDLHPRCSCIQKLSHGGNSSHLLFSWTYNYNSVHFAVQNQIWNRADWTEFLERHASVGSLKFLNSSLLWWFQVSLIAPCSPMRWIRSHSETSTISKNWKSREKQLFLIGGDSLKDGNFTKQPNFKIIDCYLPLNHRIITEWFGLKWYLEDNLVPIPL